MDEDWYRVTFIYCHDGASSVHLVGDFCGWKTDSLPMKKEGNEFRLTLPLMEGYYKYKFFVDGKEWHADPTNPHRDEEYGNSVMFIHMDPGICVRRACPIPHRAYNRPYSDGSQFQVIEPEVSADIAAYGILKRPIFVYLPPSYANTCDVKYPVMYAHDGQNVFSTPGDCGGPCWGGMYLDEILDKMWHDGDIEELILVAVPNVDGLLPGNRMKEYCTGSFIESSRDPFIRYLIECVKPAVDIKFRTQDGPMSTTSFGASMGGLLSLTLAVTHHHVFGNAICMSPSLWWVDSNNLSLFNIIENIKKVPIRLYLDSGDGDGDNKYETKEMADLLRSLGWKEGEDLMYYLDHSAEKRDDKITHNEQVWRDRVHLPLCFVFGKKQFV